MKPLVPLTPAAVVEHRTVEWDDCLGGGDHELAVQEVLAVGPSEGQVGGVAGLVLGLVLTNLDVGGACRDLHHISVALAVCQEGGSKREVRLVCNTVYSLSSPALNQNKSQY